MKLNDLIHLLTEDEIDNLELKGDWSPDAKKYGYDKPSIGILTHSKGLEKIKKKWEKTRFQFDVYLLRSKEGNKYTELGQVTWDFVRDKLKLNIDFDSDKITVIYTNNKGAELMPMTPWTMAHRLGHAMARTYSAELPSNSNHMYGELRREVDKLLQEIASTVYGKKSLNKNINSSYYSSVVPDSKLKKELAHALGTFKSARDKKLRADFEFVNELIAQYIISDKITLNRRFPSILPMKFNWGNPDGPHSGQISPERQEEINDIIDQYEASIYYAIDGLFGASVGNIYVM
jgi:hypothetical protein